MLLSRSLRPTHTNRGENECQNEGNARGEDENRAGEQAFQNGQFPVRSRTAVRPIEIVGIVLINHIPVGDLTQFTEASTWIIDEQSREHDQDNREGDVDGILHDEEHSTTGRPTAAY